MVLEHVQHEISVKGTPLANNTNSVHMFKSVDEARKKIEAWRLDYNRAASAQFSEGCAAGGISPEMEETRTPKIGRIVALSRSH